jgi:NitT/TauT family transport system permease protein
MRNVNPLYLKAARAMGASSSDIFRNVTFPHMVASYFAGLRLSMTMTLLGVILAELYVSTGGVGHFTKLFAETFDPSPLFALIGTLAVMAIALNEMVRIIERRFSRWKDQSS